MIRENDIMSPGFGPSHDNDHELVKKRPASDACVDPDEDQKLQRKIAPLALPKWRLLLRETPRDAAWERRRLQMLRRSDVHGGGGLEDRAADCCGEADRLTDEDLSELKGSIELGFGFNEEDGQALCETLPALDLYFAVNRQLSPSPVSTPRSRASTSSSSFSSLIIGRSSPMGSPRGDSESWKICSPGDDPQQVKTKIRHWAQAVACSVMQLY